MIKRFSLPILIAILALGYFAFASPKRFFNFSSPSREAPAGPVNVVLAAQFDYLSKNGNSSCSASFKDSIASMADTERLRGSCCSPMSIHRYSEQVKDLRKFAHIPEIPSDPYDIEVALAKKLMAVYDVELSSEQQKAYDYAMEHSSEKGPCCCKCWRWYVYGGLGKILIQQYGFTGEQVTDVWNLSDGCGGDSEHHHG